MACLAGRVLRSPALRGLWVVTALLVACSGDCGARGRGPGASTEATATAAAPRTLLDTARHTLKAIHAHESMKDATCWTTVRMLERFYTALPLSDHATLMKFESARNMVYRIWSLASAQATGGVVESKDLPSPDPAPASSGGRDAPEATPSERQMLFDYHQVTEGWRVVHSVVQDAIGGRGVFASRPVDLVPLSDEAAERLAGMATDLTVRLLDRARASALEARHPRIEAADLAKAYAEVARQVRLDDESFAARRAAAAPAPAHPSAEEGMRRLAELSLVNADNKVSALRKWNQALWKELGPSPEIAKVVSRLSEHPFDAEAARWLERQLINFATLAVAQLPPQRMDTLIEGSSLSFISRQVESLRARPAEPVFLDVGTIHNRTEDYFPHRRLVNGDIGVRVLWQPGDPDRTREDQVKLTAPSLDAARDLTLHWQVVARVLRDRGTVALDPFAAELLSERISELTKFLVTALDREATEAGKPTIDMELARAMELGGFLFLPPELEHTEWTDALADESRRLDEGLKRPLFVDASARLLPAAPDRECGFMAFMEANGLEAPAYRQAPGRLMGSGIAVGDFDGDGRDDVYLAGDGCNRLLRNTKEGLVDESQRRGVVDTDQDSRQPLFADVDGDGRLDLFVLHSVRGSRLFVQQQDGRFVDASAAYGVGVWPGAHTASFFDYDGDGWLDLFVGTYGSGQPDSPYPSIDGLNGHENRLFRNVGGQRFEEVSAGAGVSSRAWTLASVAFDYDLDGRQDLFLANDFGRDQLLRNRGDGTFEDVARRLAVDDRGSGMNASLVDADGDGRLDLYVTVIDMFSKALRFIFPQPSDPVKLDDRVLKSSRYVAGNKLYLNRAGGFTDADLRYFEPGDRGWGWSAAFVDFDNDGDEDMYLANGWAPETMADGQRNQLFVRTERAYHQVEGRGAEHAAFAGNSRSVAPVDADADGLVDLLVGGYRSPPRLLRNAGAAPQQRFLRVRLEGTGGNRFGVGAQVRLERAGQPPQLRQVTAGFGYLAQESTTVVFGLGESDHADRVVVRWPDGTEQAVDGPHAARTTLRVRKP